MNNDSTIRVTLSSDLMGDATEADLAAWAAYAGDRINERLAEIYGERDYVVSVEPGRYGAPGSNAIANADDAQRSEVAHAIQCLWQDWCDDGAVAT